MMQPFCQFRIIIHERSPSEGIYQLSVELTDQNIGQTEQQQTLFRVIENDQ